MFEIKLKTLRFGDGENAFAHVAHVGYLKMRDDPGPETYLTLRRLMSYIYGAPILDVSRSYTTTQHSR